MRNMVIRSVFTVMLIFNGILWLDAEIGFWKLMMFRPPMIYELCLMALVVVFAKPRKTTVYVNTGGGRWYSEREHVEV